MNTPAGLTSSLLGDHRGEQDRQPGRFGRRGAVALVLAVAAAVALAVALGPGPVPALPEGTDGTAGIALDTQQVTVKLPRASRTRITVGLVNNGSITGNYTVRATGLDRFLTPARLHRVASPGETVTAPFTVTVPAGTEPGVTEGAITVSHGDNRRTVPVAVIVESSVRQSLALGTAFDGGRTGPRTATVTVYNVGREVRVPATLNLTVTGPDGRAVRERTVEVRVGTSTRVTIPIEGLGPGEYDLRARLAYAGQQETTATGFTIEAADSAAAQPRPPRDIPFGLVLRLAAVLAAVAVLVVLTERLYHRLEHLEVDGDEEIGFEPSGTTTTQETADTGGSAEERETIAVQEAITCEDCGREFVSRQNYRIHRNSHHD